LGPLRPKTVYEPVKINDETTYYLKVSRKFKQRHERLNKQLLTMT
jgi:hypothetical protein